MSPSRCSFVSVVTIVFALAIGAAAGPDHAPKSVNILQHHTIPTSENGSQQQRMAALEQAVGELQDSITELRESNAEVRASILKLTDSNTALTRRIRDEEGELRQMVAKSVYQRDVSRAASTASPASDSTPVGGTATSRASSPLPTAERRVALSKDLWEAAVKGDAQRIRQLAAKGATFEHRGVVGFTALHEAAWYGHVDAIKALVELGAPLEAKADDGITPLHNAALSQCGVCVSELLSAGADVKARNKDGSTPLHYAARRECPSVIEILIAAGADRRAKNIYGSIPKDYAESDKIRALL